MLLVGLITISVSSFLLSGDNRSHKQKPDNHEHHTTDKKILIGKHIRHGLRVGETSLHRKYTIFSRLR